MRQHSSPSPWKGLCSGSIGLIAGTKGTKTMLFNKPTISVLYFDLYFTRSFASFVVISLVKSWNPESVGPEKSSVERQIDDVPTDLLSAYLFPYLPRFGLSSYPAVKEKDDDSLTVPKYHWVDPGNLHLSGNSGTPPYHRLRDTDHLFSALLASSLRGQIVWSESYNYLYHLLLRKTWRPGRLWLRQRNASFKRNEKFQYIF